MFIAATVPVEKQGDVNPLLEAAQQLGDDSITGDHETQTPATDAAFDPENPPMPDNGVASVERFMSSFGAPARWAGRS